VHSSGIRTILAKPMMQGAWLLVMSAVPVSTECPPPGFTSVSGFNLDTFISRPWYAQQQMAVAYQRPENFYCVSARYEKRSTPGLLGYDINVYNQAQNAQGDFQNEDNSTLCADVVNEDKGQLRVAPCFLPPVLGGAYWVLEFDDEVGYAIISGGPPTIETGNGCRTARGVNNAGLWLFTREQQRNEELVQKMRTDTAAKGFDLSVLSDVDQSVCTGAPVEPDTTAPPEPMTSTTQEMVTTVNPTTTMTSTTQEMVTTVNPEQCKENAQTTFETSDTNSDGSLDKEEFTLMIEELNVGWDAEQSEAMFAEIDVSPKDNQISFEEWLSLSCEIAPPTTGQTTTRFNATTNLQPCATTPPNPCNPTTTTEAPKRWQELAKVLIPLLLAWIKLHPKTTTTPATLPPTSLTQGAQSTTTQPIVVTTTEESSSGESSSDLWWLWMLLGLLALCCLLMCLAGVLGGVFAACWPKTSKSKKRSVDRHESYDEYEIHPIIADQSLPEVPLLAPPPMASPTMVETVQMVPQAVPVASPMTMSTMAAPMVTTSMMQVPAATSQYLPVGMPMGIR